MNPLFFVHTTAFSFATKVVATGLNDLSPNLQYVYSYTLIISFLFLMIFYNQLLKPFNIEIPEDWKIKTIAIKRIIMFAFCIVILFIVGLNKGVIQGLWLGNDVEGLRADSLSGTGWITEIPQVILMILTYVYCLSYLKHSPIKAGLLCAAMAVFWFLTTGFRGGMLRYAIVFLVYISVCYRNIRWYEYIIFISIVPFFAALTGLYRSQQEISKDAIQNYSYDGRRLDIEVMDYVDKCYNGEEYIYGLTYIIPRFLWQDKPLPFSNDIIKIKVMNKDFEGGGVAYTDPVSIFINFGEYGFIAYFFWLLFLHLLYVKLIKIKTSPYLKILLLIYLASIKLLDGMFIIQLYLLMLSAILLMLLYRRKYIL